MTLAGVVAWTLAASPAVAAEALSCPDGTADSEVTFADGTELWCARPDGTRHGPYQKRDMAGKVIERGFYEDGNRTGHWRFYDSAGRIIRTGQMSSDRPDGAWTHFDKGGVPSATITHGTFPPAEAAPPQPADPRYRWQLDLDGTPTAWWPASNARLAIAIGTRRLVLVSLNTGAIEADIPLPAPLRPDLRVEDDRILGVTGPGELFVVDLLPEGGGTWQRVRTPVGVTDAIASGSTDEVWVRAGNGRLVGIDLVSGDTTWSGKLHVDDLSPVHLGNRVVASRERREVRAVTAGDGSFAWQARMPASIVRLATAGNQVLALMGTGEVQALAADTGAPLWSLTVPLHPGVQPEVVTTADQTWITTPHEAWRLDTTRGVILDHRTAQPPEGQKAADFSVGARRACTTGRQGGVHCLPGDWTLSTAPPALPALVTESAIVVAEQTGRIRALEPALARAIAHGSLSDAELLVDELLLAEVEWGGDRVPVELPWLVVERARPDDDCSVTTAAVQLPHPDSIWPVDPPEPGTLPIDDDPTKAEPDAVLWLDDMVLYDDLGEGLFRVHEDWDEVPVGTTWRMSYWHRHRPTLSELHATIDDTTDPAEVDALIRCEAPPARFLGTAQVEDGVRAFRITGNLEVQPHPHSLDGVDGCLLDISMAGTDYGAWSSPVLPAWTEVVLEVHGDTLPEDLPLDVGVPPELVGRVWLDAYTPWATHRSDLSIDGVVDLRIDEGDHRGPILRAYQGTRLLLEVPVPELTYGAVEEDDDGEWVPVPTIEPHVDLSRAVPMSTPADAWRVLWTRSSCTADLKPEAAEASDAPAHPVESTDAPPPTTRPQPLPPAKSRWRKARPPKVPRRDKAQKPEE